MLIKTSHFPHVFHQEVSFEHLYLPKGQDLFSHTFLTYRRESPPPPASTILDICWICFDLTLICIFGINILNWHASCEVSDHQSQMLQSWSHKRGPDTSKACIDNIDEKNDVYPVNHSSSSSTFTRLEKLYTWIEKSSVSKVAKN